MAEKEYIDLYECRDDFYATVLDILSEDSTNDRANQIIDAFDYLPAANVAPVRHGEWQEINGIFRCSLCEYSFEHEGYQHFFNYCPNCGAKMDGGD